MSFSVALVPSWFPENPTNHSPVFAEQLADQLHRLGGQVTVLTTMLSTPPEDTSNPKQATRTHQSTAQGVEVLRFDAQGVSPADQQIQQTLLKRSTQKDLSPGICPLSDQQEALFWQATLGSSDLVEFIEINKGKYDHILFLSPPCRLVSEGLEAAGAKALYQPNLQNIPVAYFNFTAQLFFSSPVILSTSKETQRLIQTLYGPSVLPKLNLLDLGANDEENEGSIGQPYLDILNARPVGQLRQVPTSQTNRVVQILPDAHPFDAVSDSALFLKEFFINLGYEALILADRFNPDLSNQVQTFEADKIDPTDILVLHHSIASLEQAGCFCAHPGKKILIYHNITPHHFFTDYSPDIAKLLKEGRDELASFGEFDLTAFGDSEYNRRELQLLGFEKTGVLPLMVDPSKWQVQPDPIALKDAEFKQCKHLLFVGRIVPNKGQKDLIRLMAHLVQIQPDVHLWLVGAIDGRTNYHSELLGLIQSLGLNNHVTLTGSVDQARLKAYYMAADLYLSMSEHEGFGVPLIEAMWFDLPVFAYASSAVPETLGEAGFVFYDKTNMPQLAREVSVLLDDASLRERMVALQQNRRQDFLPTALVQRYKEALEDQEPQDGPTPVMQLTGAKRKKWGVVIQRFGREVVGGSEALCRQIVEQVSQHVDVEVLTTCATEYKTWANDYPEGPEDYAPNVKVRRFPVIRERDIPSFTTWERKHVFPGFKDGKVLDISDEVSEEWICKQGPETPALIEYLEGHHQEYDAVIFFTYLYYTTYFGTKVCPEKAWLVSTAHDEAPIYLPVFDQMIKRPQGIIFNTLEEREFVMKRFPEAYIHGDIIGIGIDPPEQPSDHTRFCEKFQITGPYVLYVGRIDNNKGADLMFDLFLRYKKDHPSDLKLVLAGKAEVPIPKHPDIQFVGFISNQEKHDAMQGCRVLINPSPFESLSMILLETWYNQRPVLVNEKCKVTVGQTERANGGGWFADYPSFKAELSRLLQDPSDYGQAKRYVELNYAWPVIEEKFFQMIHPHG